MKKENFKYKIECVEMCKSNINIIRIYARTYSTRIRYMTLCVCETNGKDKIKRSSCIYYTGEM